MIYNLQSTGFDASAAARTWLENFNAAMVAEDFDGLATLFLDNGLWRDLLAFTWNIETIDGAPAIRDTLRGSQAVVKASDFRIAVDRTPPRVVSRAGRKVVETIFAFETDKGLASGVLRLVPDPDGSEVMRAWVLLTSLDALKGHPERNGPCRPSGQAYSREFGGMS